VYLTKLSRFKILLIIFVLTGLVSACQQQPREHNDTFLVFGTIISVALFDVDEKTAAETFRFFREELQLMHKAWHPWEPGALGRVNTLLAQTGEFSAGPSVIDLLHLSKELEIKSQH